MSADPKSYHYGYAVVRVNTECHNPVMVEVHSFPAQDAREALSDIKEAIHNAMLLQSRVDKGFI